MSFLSKLLGKLPAKPSRDEFAQLVLKQTGGVIHGQPATYDAEGFRLTTENQGFTNLHNLHEDYLRAPSQTEREAVLKRTAALTQAPPDAPLQWEQVKAKLVVRPWATVYAELLSLGRELGIAEKETGEQEQKLLARPAGEGLLAAVVIEEEHGFRNLTLADAESLGGPDRLWRQARDNVYAKSNVEPQEIEPGTYLATYGDFNDASRLFLPDLFNDLKINGDLVAVAPDSNSLLLTGSGDDRGLALLIGAARQDPEHRPLLQHLVRLQDGKLEPFELPADHELSFALAEARALDLVELRNSVAELMSQMLHDAGKDWAISPLQVFGAQDVPRLTDLVVWPAKESAEMMVLMQAEIVALPVGEDVLVARWDKLMDHLKTTVGDRLHFGGEHVRWLRTDYELTPDDMETAGAVDQKEAGQLLAG